MFADLILTIVREPPFNYTSILEGFFVLLYIPLSREFCPRWLIFFWNRVQNYAFFLKYAKKSLENLCISEKSCNFATAFGKNDKFSAQIPQQVEVYPDKSGLTSSEAI